MTVANVKFHGDNIVASFMWYYIKGALDKYNIIPQLFPKKLGFLYH